jgi:hypothetical protein
LPRGVSVTLGAVLLILSACTRVHHREPSGVEPPRNRDIAATDPGSAEELFPDFPPPQTRGQAAEESARGNPLPDSLPGGNVRTHPATPTEFEEETAIAAHPTDASNLVALWQDGAIHHCWTTDGGQAWQCQLMDLGSGTTAFDPAIAVDSSGTYFAAMISWNNYAVVVAKSTDGGQSFGSFKTLSPAGGDKPYLAIDPANDNIYVVWAEAPAEADIQVHFARSTNGGNSYGNPVMISNGTDAANGALPAVGPNGEIYVVWGFADPHDRLWFDRSLDQGNSWLDPDILIDTYVQPRSPLNGDFRNPFVPAIAVDRTGGALRGRIYVVWADQRHGDPDILLSYSDDQGDTWSAATRVNDDSIGNDADQWFPWVVVDDNGHVQVTFLDRRDDPDGFLYAMYLATSTDGGVTFGPNIRVSDGVYGPSNDGFLGDYTGAAVSPDNRIHPVWPDGRTGDLDVYTHSVDLADYDEDGVLNDGDGDGQYASNRCTGGLVSGCDDNCPGNPNPSQAEQDGDRVGDLCDNCPEDSNTDQFDLDRDGLGDACDPCPNEVGGDLGDPDGDLAPNCVDNCPNTSNPSQLDTDEDGQGDPCDPFPTDPDDDGVSPGSDNCEGDFNPAQADVDMDGVGDLCDVCPDHSDPGQEDTDADGAGDACDCQTTDPTDREPPIVEGLTAGRGASDSTMLSWPEATGADVYSVSRVDLSTLAAGDYGGCLIEGVIGTTYDDAEVPLAGEGFAYIVQGQSFDCGLGGMGHDSAEIARVNGDPAACIGLSHVDTIAQGEQFMHGVVTGSYIDTQVSDDVFQTIAEEPSVPGSQASLEHRWTFNLPAGSRVELHVESHATTTVELFEFEYSTNDGLNWTPVGLSASSSPDDVDLVAELPDDLSGTVIFRVIDGIVFDGTFDSIVIDELFVRTIE